MKQSTRKVPKMEQVSFLAALASLVISGQPVATEIRRLMAAQPSLRRYASAVTKSMTVSQVLRMANFDLQAVMLAEAGEKSGQLGQALKRAVDEILSMQELKQDMYKKIIPGVVLMLLGITAILGLPTIVAEPIDNVMHQKSLRVPAGFWSHVVLNMKTLVTEYWWAAFAVIVGLFFVRGTIWKAIRNIPPFTMARDFIVLRRSILFLAVFRPLYESGIATKDAVSLMAKDVAPADREAYLQTMSRLKAGSSLSKALDSPLWAKELRSGMQGFEKAVAQAKSEVLSTINDLMLLSLNITAGRVATAMYLIGALCALTAIAMVAMGVMIPMQGIKPAR